MTEEPNIEYESIPKSKSMSKSKRITEYKKQSHKSRTSSKSKKIETVIPPEIIASEKLQLVEDQEIIVSDKMKLVSPPSIITILIICHGNDLINESFSDPNVRIISFAGRTGSIFYINPFSLQEINNLFDEKNNDYQKSIPIKGKKKYMSQLYEDNPLANKCKRTPDFVIKDGNATRQTTYDFLSANFTNQSKREDTDHLPFTIGKHGYHHLITTVHGYQPSIKSMYERKKEQEPKRQLEKHELFTEQDVEANLTHRMHTPVINKMYTFRGISEREPKTLNFGVYIMDTCNFEDSSIKVGDNLLYSKKKFNIPFLDIIKDNNRITLKQLVSFLHSLGFHTINIIDASCRFSHDINESPEGTRRNLITQRETEEFGKIDLGFGLRKNKTMKKKYRRKRSRRNIKNRK